MSADAHPLVAEAMKKAAVGWLSTDGRPATAAWLTWVDGAAYVVHEGPEQPIPGLAEASECRVGVRGEHGGRILTWRAAVERVEPGTPLWDEVAPQLAQKRLNATDPVGAPDRWATTARISRLVPVGDPVEEGASLPDDIGAAPPRPTSATTPTPIPRTFHRRR
ncbi:hypothetical protein [Cryptosporangium aurantiacum]|uniref:Pyridoxamine 5'-phosphate oxidase n=1 Tax=Cryptosporangium aurantiacum TaxID=134849 RepID=A0A1M7QQ65_9ACTN|nr:hypothetical protein [Cryptosporangium aurantiacum]SHN33439.1 hypothetical protein SAMN05443668_105146 [Cryptosporangium aurantiacum]